MSHIWTEQEEAERLEKRFEGVVKAQFAREHKLPGGASMLNQHIKGHRPLNLAAALVYARGFGVPLAEISPRLAAQAEQAAQALTGAALPAGEPPAAYGPVELTEQLRLALADLDDLPPSRQSAIIDMIHQEAEMARAAAEHLNNKRATAPATERAAHARSSAIGRAKIQLGDGNPRQGSLRLKTVDDPFEAAPSESELALYKRIEGSKR